MIFGNLNNFSLSLQLAIETRKRKRLAKMTESYIEQLVLMGFERSRGAYRHDQIYFLLLHVEFILSLQDSKYYFYNLVFHY